MRRYLMYIDMYMESPMPKRSFSIAEARSNLPSLVQDAERGTPVEITRRGKPVAVLVSVSAYERSRAARPLLGDMIAAFRETFEFPECGLSDEDMQGLRDTGSGREVSW